MSALTNNQQRFAELSNTNILNSTECRLNQKPLLVAPLNYDPSKSWRREKNVQWDKSSFISNQSQISGCCLPIVRNDRAKLLYCILSNIRRKVMELVLMQQRPSVRPSPVPKSKQYPIKLG